MNRLFRFLIYEEIMERSPMAKIQPPKVRSKVVQPISAVDVKKCWRAAKEQGGLLGARDVAIFALLLATGIRREELCVLSTDDVRLAEGILLINGKGGKQRLVPIPDALRSTLGQYLYHRKDSRAEGRCDRFFKSRQGQPMQPCNLTLLIIRLGKKAGVHLHPHRLRHTWATYFAAQDGGDVLTLQALAGWSTLAMANRYVKPSMEKMKRSAESFREVASENWTER
jgi:site-specific recombinase XerD